VERITDALHFVKVRILRNSLETIDIYSEKKRSNQINEESTTWYNKFYDVEIQDKDDG